MRSFQFCEGRLTWLSCILYINIFTYTYDNSLIAIVEKEVNRIKQGERI